MSYQFSEAIRSNIERTYTFAHAKGAHGYDGNAESYNPFTFFNQRLEKEPFETFMELERYAFRNTLNTLNRYGIPYTPEQEYRAKIYYEVTNQMAQERSDSIHRYIDGDLQKTGIVKLTDNFLLTTKATVAVAKFIKSLPKNKQTKNILYTNNINDQLSESKEQMRALELSIQTHVSCIIGGAGTGKSYVTGEIINQLRLNGKEVAILAPTHKAKESLQNKLTGGKVQTIHSFVHRPFECDVIVIDESGMLSTPLFNQLVNVYNGEQLIFIGDKNQLPPVEYGRPFELIQDRFHTSELKQNKRSEARDIISLGNQILGKPQNANMAAENIHIATNAQDAHEKGAEVILTFTNQNVKAINEQRRLKTGMDSIYSGFKVGERIIAKTNYKNKFYNGQLFKVVGYNTIQDVNTNRTVTLKSSKELEYNFDYAYALTIHKSQGSEWDVVGYLPSEHDTMNLAYVAITRAKKKLIIINGLNDSYKIDRKWRQLHEAYRI